jgi:hypothetical protein
MILERKIINIYILFRDLENLLKKRLFCFVYEYERRGKVEEIYLNIQIFNNELKQNEMMMILFII